MPTPSRDWAARKIAECDRKLAQYRDALDAGGGSATVAKWIAETEAEGARYEMSLRQSAAETRGRMTGQEIKFIVERLADIAEVLAHADPDDKAEIFRQLGLKLTYQPGTRIVEARIDPRGSSRVSEAGLEPAQP